MSRAYLEFFFRKRVLNFVTFLSVVFSTELILSNLSNKNDWRGVWEHAPKDQFLKFTCCNGHFSAFWTILTQILFKFMAPKFECFTTYDAFCLHSFNYACSRRFTVMQTAGVKIGEDFQKRVSTSGSPPRLSNRCFALVYSESWFCGNRFVVCKIQYVGTGTVKITVF